MSRVCLVVWWCEPRRSRLRRVWHALVVGRVCGRLRLLGEALVGVFVVGLPFGARSWVGCCSASRRRRDRRVDSPRERRGCRYPAAGGLAGLQRAGGHGCRGRSAPRRGAGVFRGHRPGHGDVERASIVASLRAVAHGLGHGRALPDRLPPGAVDEALLAANEGLPWVAVLRTYTIGHASLWEQMCAQVERRGLPDARRVEAVRVLSRYLFAYVDQVTGQLAEVYQTERDRLLRSQERRRASLTRELLAGMPVSEEELRVPLACGSHRRGCVGSEPRGGRHASCAGAWLRVADCARWGALGVGLAGWTSADRGRGGASTGAVLAPGRNVSGLRRRGLR